MIKTSKDGKESIWKIENLKKSDKICLETIEKHKKQLIVILIINPD